MFNCQDIQPLDAGIPVEDPIGPDSVGPDCIFLKLFFERFAVEGMFGEVADGVFDCVPSSSVEGGHILDGLRVSLACLTAFRRTRP
jgi:hypothetical protein